MRAPVLALLAALALVLAACGSSSKSGGDSSSASSSPATTAPALPKPTITVPKGPPPTTLQVKDLKKGTGAVAADGETLTVNYVGALYKNGKVFDSSFSHGQPFQVPIGQGQVIKGWDQGLIGMRVGGRRELIIPPSLGYGSQRSGKIPPNSTLIFVIDLLGVQ